MAEANRTAFEAYCAERGLDIEREGNDYAWVCERWAVWEIAFAAGWSHAKRESLAGYYKVPFRQVYCETVWQWIGSVWQCHVVYRLRPPVLPR